MLSAQPATPVQLAHACMAAGFQAVVPASWGDEIIACRVLHRVRDAGSPRVQCSCPLVARRLADHHNALPNVLLHFVPPPVATARYLRSVYRDVSVQITYAGDCPFAPTEAIDTQVSCLALLERLASVGVSLMQQPKEFDSVLPPDRRRHFSEPGGIPNGDMLRQLGRGADLVQLTDGDVVVDLAQHLLDERATVLDVAASLGCRCSGALDDVSPADARARVRAHEPPRSHTPVVDHDVPVRVESDERQMAVAHDATRTPVDMRADVTAPIDTTSEPARAGGEPPARRRSAPGISRAVLGAMPLSRSDGGRQLPRLYVARRRSSPRGLRESAIRREAPSATPVTPVTAVSPGGAVPPITHGLRRFRQWLVVLVLGVLAVALTVFLAR